VVALQQVDAELRVLLVSGRGQTWGDAAGIGPTAGAGTAGIDRIGKGAEDSAWHLAGLPATEAADGQGSRPGTGAASFWLEGASSALRVQSEGPQVEAGPGAAAYWPEGASSALRIQSVGPQVGAGMDAAAAAALAAENAALRRSVAAQTDRIDALRSDLTNARDSEAAAAEKLRAARATVVTAAAAAADDADVSVQSARVANLGGRRANGNNAVDDAVAAGALREALDASREMSRQQGEAQVILDL